MSLVEWVLEDSLYYLEHGSDFVDGKIKIMNKVKKNFQLMMEHQIMKTRTKTIQFCWMLSMMIMENSMKLMFQQMLLMV